jgi:hypothetical protein
VPTDNVGTIFGSIKPESYLNQVYKMSLMMRSDICLIMG